MSLKPKPAMYMGSGGISTLAVGKGAGSDFAALKGSGAYDVGDGCKSFCGLFSILSFWAVVLILIYVFF